MEITIFNATSCDGFIAKTDDDTDWVSDVDWNLFMSKVQASKVVIMGRRTYEASGKEFPYACELNVVMTHDQKLIEKYQNKPGVWFTDLDPVKIVARLAEKYSELLVIGGGITNAAYLQAGLVNKIIIDVHPLILGTGKPLFGGVEFSQQLELVEVTQNEGGLVQLTYLVKK